MKRLSAVALLLTLAACTSSIGPDPRARQHAVTTNIVACANSSFDLQVSWVEWNWQAVYLKGAQQVATVTDSSLTHSSGCVYAAGDKARVKLVPLGDIAKYLDSTFVDVAIQ